MTKRADLGLRALAKSVLLAAATTVACGGSASSVVGGESHFLSYCDNECDAGFDCISGVCTQSCLIGEASCDALGDGVTCTDQSIEPGEVAVCDLACDQDSDCNSLGDAYQCDSGYCRHDPNGGSSISSGGSGGSGSGGSGSGGSATSAGAGTTGSGASNGGGACEVLFMEFADGETGIPDPAGCGLCECNDGELSCTDEACPNDAPRVFKCPLVDGEVVEPMSDPFNVIASVIEGDTLVVDVSHSGGCADHDYGMCYMDAFLESFPVQGSLQLLHDANGDMCEAELQKELRFDLTPYADYYRELYQTDSGEIVTEYGSYVF